MRKICLTILLLSAFFNVVAADAPPTSQLEKIKETINNLKEMILQKEGKKNSLTNDLTQLEQKINDSNQQLRQINQKIQQQNNLLQPLLLERKKLEQAVTKERAQLALQLQAAYKMGDYGALELLFGGEDPQKLERTMIYYQAFNTARINLITSYLGNLEAIKRNETKINQSLAESKELQTAQMRAHTHLTTQEQERAKLIDKINNQINTGQQRITQLESDKKRLEQVINNLTVGKNYADVRGVDFDKLKGKLPWPTTGTITRSFGQIYDERLVSNGVFITTANNQTVRVIANGQVIFANYLRGYGNLIIVSHNGGYMTLYAHNNALFKAVGDNVDAGDELALSGNSGGLNENGLYFEIRYQGKPSDPTVWCKGKP